MPVTPRHGAKFGEIPLDIYAEYAACLSPESMNMLLRSRLRVSAAIFIQYHLRRWRRRRIYEGVMNGTRTLQSAMRGLLCKQFLLHAKERDMADIAAIAAEQEKRRLEYAQAVIAAGEARTDRVLSPIAETSIVEEEPSGIDHIGDESNVMDTSNDHQDTSSPGIQILPRRRRAARKAESSSDSDEFPVVRRPVSPTSPQPRLATDLPPEAKQAGVRIWAQWRIFKAKRNMLIFKMGILVRLVLRLQALWRGRQVRSQFRTDVMKKRRLDQMRREVDEHEARMDAIKRETKPKYIQPKFNESKLDLEVGVVEAPVHAAPLVVSSLLEDTDTKSAVVSAKQDSAGHLASVAELTEGDAVTSDTEAVAGGDPVSGTPADAAIVRASLAEEEAVPVVLPEGDSLTAQTTAVNVIKSSAITYATQQCFIRLEAQTLVGEVAAATESALTHSVLPPVESGSLVELEPVDVYLPKDVKGVLSRGVVVEESSPLHGTDIGKSTEWIVDEVTDLEVFELHSIRVIVAVRKIQKLFRRFLTRRKFLAYLNEKDLTTVRAEEVAVQEAALDAAYIESEGLAEGEVPPPPPVVDPEKMNTDQCLIM